MNKLNIGAPEHIEPTGCIDNKSPNSSRKCIAKLNDEC